MTEHDLQNALQALLGEIAWSDADDLDHLDVPAELAGIDEVRTYQEAGVLTRDAGFVVRTDDGAEFQVTIVRSR